MLACVLFHTGNHSFARLGVGGALRRTSPSQIATFRLCRWFGAFGDYLLSKKHEPYFRENLSLTPIEKRGFLFAHYHIRARAKLPYTMRRWPDKSKLRLVSSTKLEILINAHRNELRVRTNRLKNGDFMTKQL